VAVLALACPALAQSTASLRGAVSDEQGAPVAGAKVLVKNQATGEERTAQSDPRGEFLVASIAPGPYRLEVRADGFQTRVVKDLRLEVAQTMVQNVRLAIGSLSEELAVVGVVHGATHAEHGHRGDQRQEQADFQRAGQSQP